MRDPYQAAFVQAKTQAMFSTFRLGKSLSDLTRSSSLLDLFQKAFGKQPPPMPDHALLKEFEIEARRLLALRIGAIFACHDGLPPVLRALVSSCDIMEIKLAIASLKKGDPFTPFPGVYSYLDVARWPDIPAVVRGTPFEWVASEAEKNTTFENETRLDRTYSSLLWDAVDALAGEERTLLRDLVRDECELQNVLWALRLKQYFRRKIDEIEECLTPLPGADVESAALFPLVFDLSKPENAARWKWRGLLSPEVFGPDGKISARILEDRAMDWTFRKYRATFHKAAFTSVPAFCFIKLAMVESDALKSCAEAVRLGMQQQEIEKYLGVIAC